MSDAPTLVTVAAGAIALGASALRLTQYVIHRNSHKNSQENGNGGVKTVGKLNVLALERMLEEAARLNTTNNIIPILDRLTKVAEQQVAALHSFEVILAEIRTIMGMERRSIRD